jgi:hypothetical protein
MEEQPEVKRPKPVLVRLSSSEHERLALAVELFAAAGEPVSMSNLLRRALQEYLDAHVEFPKGDQGRGSVDAIVRTDDGVYAVQLKKKVEKRADRVDTTTRAKRAT